jgi:hypothetical protein
MPPSPPVPELPLVPPDPPFDSEVLPPQAAGARSDPESIKANRQKRETTSGNCALTGIRPQAE